MPNHGYFQRLDETADRLAARDGGAEPLASCPECLQNDRIEIVFVRIESWRCHCWNCPASDDQIVGRGNSHDNAIASWNTKALAERKARRK
jgi:hypothetical protein